MGCPATKHIERALDDRNVFIVYYDGKHNHSLSVSETQALKLAVQYCPEDVAY